MNPTRSDAEALAMAERHLDRGALEAARDALLDCLDQRARDGDAACALAARLLRAQAAPTDALATATDRLLRVLETQDAQIRALQALLEDTL